MTDAISSARARYPAGIFRRLHSFLSRFSVRTTAEKHHVEVAVLQKDWPEAIVLCQQIIDRLGRETPPDIYLKMSHACRNHLDFERADTVGRQAVARYPEHLALAIDFMQTAVAQNDWPNAVKRGDAILEKWGAKTPAIVYRYLSLAHRSHRKFRDYAAAEAIVRRGLEHYPKNFDLECELAEIAAKQEDWPETEKRWQHVIATHKTLPYAYCALSIAQRSKGDWDAAEATLREGMAKRPNDAQLMMELAQLAMTKQDWTTALERWRTVAAEHGEPLAYYRNLSIVLHHLGDFGSADDALQKSLELEYAQPRQTKTMQTRRFKRVVWEQSDDLETRAENRIKNLRSYVKAGAEPDMKVFSGYHAIEIKGKVIAGKRDAHDRLNMMPFDLSDKSVLDIGCNQGGALFDIADRIRWGVGVDYDTRIINVANCIRSEKGVSNLDFYTFNLERDPLPLIRDMMPERTVDIVFLLAVCAHIKNWRQVIDFTAEISRNMLFEAHGNDWLQLGQIRRVKNRYKRVELIGQAGSGDPSMRTRKLYFCSQD